MGFSSFQAAIRKELNEFKSTEMEVHELSRHLTRLVPSCGFSPSCCDVCLQFSLWTPGEVGAEEKGKPGQHSVPAVATEAGEGPDGPG